MTYPVFMVPSELSRTYRGVWLHNFQCPICGKLHHHGGGDGDVPTAYGSRVPHCIFERITPEGRTVFVLNKDFDFDVQPDNADVNWHAHCCAANAYAAWQVESAGIPRKDKDILLRRLSINLERALSTLP